MLSKFDWLRRCRDGAEFLATLRFFSERPEIDLSKLEIGGPLSAIGPVCHRCKIYAPIQRPKHHHRYCKICEQVMKRRIKFLRRSQTAIIVWGYVNQIPKRLRESKPSRFIYGTYIHDDQHFLAMIHRQHLKQWLQELVIYAGLNFKGSLQILPSLGEFRFMNIGDYLCWAIHHEATLPLDQLRVRFFTRPEQLINPKKREKEGLLTFHISDFINMLEMVEVFRVYLYPQQQQDLLALLNLSDPKEEQFYWGRFLGQISPEAKDMLNAWQVRQWTKQQTQFFYHLINYVYFPQPN